MSGRAQELLAKAHETQAKFVYLANPDNPSGTVHSQARHGTPRQAHDRVPALLHCFFRGWM